MHNSTFLIEKWTISRGRDSYGYNICTIKDAKTGAKGRCSGGGYDMAGTSLAACLENMPEVYARLAAFVTPENAGMVQGADMGFYNYRDIPGVDVLYGVTLYQGGQVRVDGATGYDNVRDIYARSGVTITPSYEAGGKLHDRLGWFVTWED